MIGPAVVAAGIAGLAASLIARRLTNHYRRAWSPPKLLPQIIADLRQLVAGTNPKVFLTEYLQLLRRLGQLAAVQTLMLAINLATLTMVYALACWPLASGAAPSSSHPLGDWISDIDLAFVLAAIVGSLVAPLIIRPRA